MVLVAGSHPHWHPQRCLWSRWVSHGMVHAALHSWVLSTQPWDPFESWALLSVLPHLSGGKGVVSMENSQLLYCATVGLTGYFARGLCQSPMVHFHLTAGCRLSFDGSRRGMWSTSPPKGLLHPITPLDAPSPQLWELNPGKGWGIRCLSAKTFDWRPKTKVATPSFFQILPFCPFRAVSSLMAWVRESHRKTS